MPCISRLAYNFLLYVSVHVINALLIHVQNEIYTYILKLALKQAYALGVIENTICGLCWKFCTRSSSERITIGYDFIKVRADWATKGTFLRHVYNYQVIYYSNVCR